MLTLFNKLANEILGDERGVLGAEVCAGRVATVVEDSTAEEVVVAEDENRHSGFIFEVVVSGSDLHGGVLYI